jgi:hypothetical protein
MCKGEKRQVKVRSNMPLTEEVTFKTKLQRHNRLVIPRILRWRYKLEPGELLKVIVMPFGLGSGQEEFLAKMAADGRLTIPKLTVEILQQTEDKNLTSSIIEVTIRPVAQLDDNDPPQSAQTRILDEIKDIRKSLGNSTP